MLHQYDLRSANTVPDCGAVGDVPPPSVLDLDRSRAPEPVRTVIPSPQAPGLGLGLAAATNITMATRDGGVSPVTALPVASGWKLDGKGNGGRTQVFLSYLIDRAKSSA